MQTNSNTIAFSGRVTDIKTLNYDYYKNQQAGFDVNQKELTDINKNLTKIKDAISDNDEFVKQIENDTNLDVGVGVDYIYVKNKHKVQTIFGNFKDLNLNDFVTKTLAKILEPKQKQILELLGSSEIDPDFDPAIPPYIRDRHKTGW